MDVAGLDLTQALIIAAASATLTLAGGAGIAFINYWLGLRKDRRLKEDDLGRAGNYLAIRVVCLLDAFVDGCVNVALDNGRLGPSGEKEPEHAAPKLEYPTDVDWKTIKSDLMYQALALPNGVSAAMESIASASEFTMAPDHEEYFEARSIAFGEIGLKAIGLANDFRAAYGIPQRELGAHYDPADQLQKKLEKVRSYVRAKQESWQSQKQMAGGWAEREKAGATPKDDAGHCF